MKIPRFAAKSQTNIGFVLFVFLVSVYLRVNGLSWGTDGTYGANYHPDEGYGMIGMEQIDLLHGQLAVPVGYFEGTFNYYLWAVPIAFAQMAGYDVVPSDDRSYAHILFWARSITVLLDELTIIIIWLAAYEATTSFYAAAVGALFYSIIPIEVIYAHFMRPHVLANTLCAAVLWLSLRMIKRRRWGSPAYVILIGVISGLAAATRYTLAIVVLLPCLLLLSNYVASHGWTSDSRVTLRSFPIFVCWLTLGFALGIFIGEPMLFLRPQAVWKGIVDLTLPFVAPHAFDAAGFANLRPLRTYLRFLIPFGMFPLLWLLPYSAVIYLCFCRNRYALTIPLLVFLLIYLYPMSKGYSNAMYARATMPIFPITAVLIALAVEQIRRGRERAFVFCISCGFASLMLPSIIFDYAYTRAMRHRDVRSIVRDDLQRMIGGGSATIGVSKSGVYFYTVLPAVFPLNSSRVLVKLQTAGVPADYYVVGFQGARQRGEVEAKIKAVEATGNYRLVKFYDKRPHIFVGPMALLSFPPDMTYPFPAIALFLRNSNAKQLR